MNSTVRPEDWRRHTQALRRMARQLLRGEADADDLVQGTVLKALQRPPRRLTRTWMVRVLRHQATDLLRRRRREQAKPRPARETAPGSDQVVERIETFELLAAAVRTLREPYRETIYLRYFEDRSPTEIE